MAGFDSSPGCEGRSCRYDLPNMSEPAGARQGNQSAVQGSIPSAPRRHLCLADMPAEAQPKRKIGPLAAMRTNRSQASGVRRGGEFSTHSASGARPAAPHPQLNQSPTGERVMASTAARSVRLRHGARRPLTNLFGGCGPRPGVPSALRLRVRSGRGTGWDHHEGLGMRPFTSNSIPRTSRRRRRDRLRSRTVRRR